MSDYVRLARNAGGARGGRDDNSLWTALDEVRVSKHTIACSAIAHTIDRRVQLASEARFELCTPYMFCPPSPLTVGVECGNGFPVWFRTGSSLRDEPEQRASGGQGPEQQSPGAGRATRVASRPCSPERGRSVHASDRFEAGWLVVKAKWFELVTTSPRRYKLSAQDRVLVW